MPAGAFAASPKRSRPNRLSTRRESNGNGAELPADLIDRERRPAAPMSRKARRIAAQTGRSLQTLSGLGDLQEVNGVFPLFMFAGEIGHPVADAAEKSIETELPSRPYPREILPRGIRVYGLVSVDKEMLGRIRGSRRGLDHGMQSMKPDIGRNDDVPPNHRA
jgi:hypothetical protein